MDVYITESNIHGRGVFANKDFQEGELIESAQMIILPSKDIEYIDKTSLYDYYFSWEEGKIAIGLGNASIFNHSYTPNAKYVKNYQKNILEYYAIKKITIGEEITTNYNGDPDAQKKVRFEKG